jgi:hypothetical protein
MLASRYLHTSDGGCFAIPAFVWYIIVVIVIFAYGYILRQANRPDVLERKVIDDPAVHNCDGWAMTHLVFWGFLGFLYPGHYVQALICSLAWEGFEDFLGRTKITLGGSRLQLVGDVDEETQEVTGDDDMTWHGRYVTDTFYNLTGYIIGSWAGGKWWPDESCKEHGCPPRHPKRAQQYAPRY